MTKLLSNEKLGIKPLYQNLNILPFHTMSAYAKNVQN